jgi:hypothetical protein
MPINLSNAEARKMGLLPDEPEPKKAKEWGTGQAGNPGGSVPVRQDAPLAAQERTHLD